MASEISKIEKQLHEIASHIEKKDAVNPAISKAAVGWHLAHLLKILNSVYVAMEISRPEDHKPEFNLKKALVFTTGKIPRGKASAPKSGLPEENLDKPTLHAQVQEAFSKFSNIEKIPETANFKHPYFGYLNKSKTLKFLRIHNEHHLKIVRDIVKEAIT